MKPSDFVNDRWGGLEHMQVARNCNATEKGCRGSDIEERRGAEDGKRESVVFVDRDQAIGKMLSSIISMQV